MPALQRLKPLFRVALPVAVASTLVCLAVVHMALVKAWKGEPEDGVLWVQDGANVSAKDVADRTAGHRAGVKPGDVLLTIDGREMSTVEEVQSILHASEDGKVLRYVIHREDAQLPI